MDKKTFYAIPLVNNETNTMFFVTFNTKDKEDAIKLTKCVTSKKSLVNIDENGMVWYV